MTVMNADTMELDDRDLDVLAVLAEGRANPMLLRERTDYGKGSINTSLNRLCRSGLATQVTRALYEITPQGERRLNDE